MTSPLSPEQIRSQAMFDAVRHQRDIALADMIGLQGELAFTRAKLAEAEARLKTLEGKRAISEAPKE